MTAQTLTLAQAAQHLHKSTRWLREWLRLNPHDGQGQPFCTPVGRDRIFHRADIARIEATMREKITCRSASGRQGRVKRRIMKSEAHTSESEWKLAQALLNDPSLKPSSKRLSDASKNMDVTQNPRLRLVHPKERPS